MKILRIDNVFFQVGSLEEAVPFYEKMGFVLKFRIPHIKAALFNIGLEEPGLIVFENKQPKPSRLWVEVPSAIETQKELNSGSLIEAATGWTLEVLDPWKNTIGFADYSKKSELAHPQKDLLIRPMTTTDIERIVSCFSFPWSTPEKTQKIWETYSREQQEGVRTVAVLENEGEIWGYGSLLRKSECSYFASANIPEINAIWIDENHRRQGLGKALIRWIENLARQEGYQRIGIGVGLYQDYGPAQRLYVQLGYIPDGNGITYKGQSTVAGKSYPLDDDFILWFTKALT